MMPYHLSGVDARMMVNLGEYILIVRYLVAVVQHVFLHLWYCCVVFIQSSTSFSIYLLSFVSSMYIRRAVRVDQASGGWMLWLLLAWCCSSFSSIVDLI